MIPQKLPKKKRLQDWPQINEDANFTLKFDEIELILQNSPFFVPSESCCHIKM